MAARSEPNRAADDAVLGAVAAAMTTSAFYSAMPVALVGATATLMPTA